MEAVASSLLPLAAWTMSRQGLADPVPMAIVPASATSQGAGDVACFQRGSAPPAPTLTGRTSNDTADFAQCCGPFSRYPKRASDTGLRPGPSPTRAASLLPGLLTATRTGLAPASDDEHEQQDHPQTRSPPFSAGRTKDRG